jgi:hypothetical protein
VVSYHPDPPQLLRARLRLALHSRGGKDLNRLVHHERGRYSRETGFSGASNEGPPRQCRADRIAATLAVEELAVHLDRHRRVLVPEERGNRHGSRLWRPRSAAQPDGCESRTCVIGQACATSQPTNIARLTTASAQPPCEVSRSRCTRWRLRSSGRSRIADSAAAGGSADDSDKREGVVGRETCRRAAGVTSGSDGPGSTTSGTTSAVSPSMYWRISRIRSSDVPSGIFDLALKYLTPDADLRER